MDVFIKDLHGYSGSLIQLIRRDSTLLVRKTGNIQRNIERMTALTTHNILMPTILNYNEEFLELEYIPHINMITWLLHNPVDQFINWMIDCINKLKKDSYLNNWLEIYEARLTIASLVPFWHQLPFTTKELIAKLPNELPISSYHGDLTMDNCIHSADGQFYLIDPITSDYSSWVFDIAKLMQDLECGWFIRNNNVMIQGKLWVIKNAILDTYPVANNKNLIILMLLRILPYAKTHQDQEFIIKEINRLWTQ